MKHLLVLFLLIGFTRSSYSSTPFEGATQGDCDTILTLEGKSYVCQILRQDGHEIQFSLCDDPTGRAFSIPNERVVRIRGNSIYKFEPNKSQAEGHIKGLPKTGNLPKKSTSDPDQNPQWLSVDVVQAIKKGAAFQFEYGIGERGSLLLDFGMRWHDPVSPGIEVFEYEQTTRKELLSAPKSSYSNAPPKDYGDFAPNKSLHIAFGPRIYLNRVTANSFFIQPSFYLFYHTGVNITDTKALLHSSSSSNGWFSSTTVSQWQLTRKATKSSRSSLGFSFSMGYRVLDKKGLALELGTALGRTFSGANVALPYYGLSDLFIRPFLSVGYRLP